MVWRLIITFSLAVTILWFLLVLRTCRLPEKRKEEREKLKRRSQEEEETQEETSEKDNKYPHQH